MVHRKRYTWGGWHYAKVPAKVVGAIIEEHGQLSARDLVSLARPKRHPLHTAFTWDDRRAAAKHREHEARLMLNHLSVVIVTRGKLSEPRALVAQPHTSTRANGRKYAFVEAVDEITWRQALVEAKRDVAALAERYRAWPEVRAYFHRLRAVA